MLYEKNHKRGEFSTEICSQIIQKNQQMLNERGSTLKRKETETWLLNDDILNSVS